MGVLYSALQGWQLVTAFQFGSLSSPRDEDKVLKWLAELLWKLADLKAECHDMKPVMLMAINTSPAELRFPLKEIPAALADSANIHTYCQVTSCNSGQAYPWITE